MNNQGLCVTTSSADVNHTGRIGQGFVFPLAVRAMLEQCSTAYEAKEMFMEMPYAEYRNFLISDKTSTAILIEASPKKKSYKCVNIDDKRGFLCSADHFILEQDNDINPVKHSVIRQRKMEEVLSRDKKISLEDVKALLSGRYPGGLAFPYYQGGMGTLWSIIYEPLSLSQYVCYGSPEYGIWNLVDQNGEPGCNETKVMLANIDVPTGFWE